MQEYSLRQAGILINAGNRLTLTVPQASDRAVIAARCHRCARSSVGRRAPGGRKRGVAAFDYGELIQYTRKARRSEGVFLTHANLWPHRASRGDSRVSTDVGVSWLPLYTTWGDRDLLS